MTEQEMLKWIAKASYEDLLRKWRFEPHGSLWFVGPVAEAFDKRMRKERAGITIEEAVAISKKVGWDHSINPRDFKTL